MPDPPHVGLLTRYVLENPWPLGLGLLLIAAVAGFTGLREGLAGRIRLAGFVALAGAAVLAIGAAVTTSGEHARRITRELVDAAVQGDVAGAISLFAEQATYSVGSPRNPGLGRDFIERELSQLTGRYRIDSNTITMLRSYSESSNLAEVHLACWTSVGGFTTTPSQWVLRIQRQPDDAWKIVRLTCISIGGRTPPSPGAW